MNFSNQINQVVEKNILPNNENEALEALFNLVLEAVMSCNEKELQHHLLNTYQWAGVLENGVEKPTVRSLTPISIEIKIAALGHELERVNGNALRPHDFQNFGLYKEASHTRSADIIRELGEKVGLKPKVIEKISHLVKNSVTEDSEKMVSIIREADALSFFSLSLPFFIAPLLSSEKVLQDICLWEFNRLGSRGKKHLSRFCNKFTDIRLKYYISSMFGELVN